MRVLGMVTTGLLVGVAFLAAFVGARSIPDLQRYLKIRQM